MRVPSRSWSPSSFADVAAPPVGEAAVDSAIACDPLDTPEARLCELAPFFGDEQREALLRQASTLRRDTALSLVRARLRDAPELRRGSYSGRHDLCDEVTRCVHFTHALRGDSGDSGDGDLGDGAEASERSVALTARVLHLRRADARVGAQGEGGSGGEAEGEGAVAVGLTLAELARQLHPLYAATATVHQLEGELTRQLERWRAAHGNATSLADGRGAVHARRTLCLPQVGAADHASASSAQRSRGNPSAQPPKRRRKSRPKGLPATGTRQRTPTSTAVDSYRDTAVGASVAVLLANAPQAVRGFADARVGGLSLSAARAIALLERAAQSTVDPAVLYELHAERCHLERALCACHATLHRLVRVASTVSTDGGTVRRWLCEAEFDAYVHALWPADGRVDLPSAVHGVDAAGADFQGVVLHEGLYDAARHTLEALLAPGNGRDERWPVGSPVGSPAAVDADDVRGFLLHATFHELRELALVPFAMLRARSSGPVEAVRRSCKAPRLASAGDTSSASASGSASGSTSSVYHTTCSSSSQGSSVVSRSSASSYHSAISDWHERCCSEEGVNGKALARRFTELQMAVEMEAAEAAEAADAADAAEADRAARAEQSAWLPVTRPYGPLAAIEPTLCLRRGLSTA